MPPTLEDCEYTVLPKRSRPLVLGVSTFTEPVLLQFEIVPCAVPAALSTVESTSPALPTMPPMLMARMDWSSQSASAESALYGTPGSDTETAPEFETPDTSPVQMPATPPTFLMGKTMSRVWSMVCETVNVPALDTLEMEPFEEPTSTPTFSTAFALSVAAMVRLTDLLIFTFEMLEPSPAAPMRPTLAVAPCASIFTLMISWFLPSNAPSNVRPPWPPTGNASWLKKFRSPPSSTVLPLNESVVVPAWLSSADPFTRLANAFH